jgi:hypothetical protein
MKRISILKNATSSILMAGLVAGLVGFAHAQTSGSSGSGQAGGAMSGQGGSTSGEAITGQRNPQGDGTTDTTGKGTSGQDDSYSMSPRKKGSGSTGQQRGSDSSGSGSGGSQGSGGSGGSAGGGGY